MNNPRVSLDITFTSADGRRRVIRGEGMNNKTAIASAHRRAVFHLGYANDVQIVKIKSVN